MSVSVLLITNGRREYFQATVASLWEMWRGPEPASAVLVDDSGDPAFTEFAQSLVSKWPVHYVAHQALSGFAAAIDTGWSFLRDVVHPDWVFHLEDDFTFNGPVPVYDMIEVLEARPYLVQMSLMRQAWNDEEKAAGGVMQAHPADFADCTDGTHHWVEQRRYFTTNPSVYRGDFVRRGWPQVPESEGKLTRQLLDHGFEAGGVRVEPQDVRFGIWGRTTDEPRVTHIGEQRIGTGY